jgi:hypothetical protein
MIAFGSHHANAFVPGLLSQSRERWIVSLAMDYGVKQEGEPVAPARSAWIGGQGTDP